MRRKKASAGPRASSPRTRPRAESRTRAPRDAATPADDAGQRLQKALAQLGLGSRREAEAWIRAGRLTVNGIIAALGTRVRATDQVRLDGRLIRQRTPPSQQVFICHRSPGDGLQRPQAGRSSELSSDEMPREPLLARLPRTAGRRFVAVSPMPGIDGGLELVTSDGELAAQLQRAVRLLTADFSVRVLGELTDAQLASLRAGVLDSGETLEILDCEPSGGEGANRWYTVTARGASGKDVRQLFERQGARVGRVLRTRLGPVRLDRALARGQFRRLGAGETRALLGLSDEGPTPH
jgi:23S rRNA pseudouridine2605 synthase